MADFAGTVLPATVLPSGWPTRKSSIYARGSVIAGLVVNEPSPLDSAVRGGAIVSSGNSRAPKPRVAREGSLVEDTGIGREFFEITHVLPRRIALGNVLTTQIVSVEIFNANRKTSITWNDFDNLAGTGIDLLGEPSLPVTILNLAGVTGLTLEVLATGTPTVDGTLEWTFSEGIVSIGITLNRVVLFALQRPELPFNEDLEFATIVNRAKSGKEQRIRLRNTPRQILNYLYFTDEGVEQSLIENLLYGNAGGVFGVPVWQEEMRISADAALGATAVTVESNANRDIRLEGLVLVVGANGSEVFEVSALPDTATIEFTNVTGFAYTIGDSVYPLRLCATSGEVSISRERLGGSRINVAFRSVENDIDIRNADFLGTYNSRSIVSGFNLAAGAVDQTAVRTLTVLDSILGQVFQESAEPNAVFRGVLTLFAQGIAAIWSLRRLLHSIGGRQVAFYLPTNTNTFALTSSLISGENEMNIRNVKFAQFGQARLPRKTIRVTFNTGDASLIREIASATEVDAENETIELTENWPDTYLVSEVARIEIVELVRLNEDTVTLQWQPSGNSVKVTVPVIGTL